MNFQAKLKQIRELAGLDENVKSLLEKMTGKELVSYEGIDALVAALMGFYNVELKKKAPSSHTHGWGDVTGKPGSFPPSSHTHDDRYYTESEINEKFKNFCPFPVGSVLQMWNETNPTSLYLGTTWELISAGKYVKTGDRALQTGGSNSISIQKANLPNIKLKIDSFSLTTQPHNHSVPQISGYSDNPDQAHANRTALGAYNGRNARDIYTNNTASSTNTASLNTESLGNGTALSIQPEYITLKYWKRTS